MPISEIADRLGRDPSTIYRDIKRNRYTDADLPELNGYHALVAQDKYEKRRALHRKMIVHPDLKAAIEDRLKAGWSAEQIAGRMRLERHPIRMSHEAIIGPPIPGTVVTSSPIVTSPSLAAADRVAFAGMPGPTSSIFEA